MGEAYQCSSAVLNITSNCESDLINSGRGALHEPKDQLGMFRSVTGWNALIDNVEEIPAHIHRAFELFLNGRPRRLNWKYLPMCCRKKVRHGASRLQTAFRSRCAPEKWKRQQYCLSQQGVLLSGRAAV